MEKPASVRENSLLAVLRKHNKRKLESVRVPPHCEQELQSSNFCASSTVKDKQWARSEGEHQTRPTGTNKCVVCWNQSSKLNILFAHFARFCLVELIIGRQKWPRDTDQKQQAILSN